MKFSLSIATTIVLLVAMLVTNASAHNGVGSYAAGACYNRFSYAAYDIGFGYGINYPCQAYPAVAAYASYAYPVATPAIAATIPYSYPYAAPIAIPQPQPCYTAPVTIAQPICTTIAIAPYCYGR